MFQKPVTPSYDQYIDFDSEFYNTGGSVEVLTLGFVRDDGERLYLLNPEIQRVKEKIAATAKDTWVMDNVLHPDILMAHNPIIPTNAEQMAHMVYDFCGRAPIFTTYCGAYDMVALRSLFGSMIEGPKDWRYTCLDLAHPLSMMGLRSRDFPQAGEELPEHNAMADALWTQRVRRLLPQLALNHSPEIATFVRLYLTSLKPR